MAPVELFEYVENVVETHGPCVPADLTGLTFKILQLSESKFLCLFLAYFSAIRSPVERQLAGGFTIEVGLSRALLGFSNFSLEI